MYPYDTKLKTQKKKRKQETDAQGKYNKVSDIVHIQLVTDTEIEWISHREKSSHNISYHLTVDSFLRQKRCHSANDFNLSLPNDCKQ